MSVELCEFCFVKHTLLESLKLQERRLLQLRAQGHLMTAALENVAEARRLLQNHKHVPTGAMA